jgi:hypothetical protein
MSPAQKAAATRKRHAKGTKGAQACTSHGALMSRKWCLLVFALITGCTHASDNQGGKRSDEESESTQTAVHTVKEVADASKSNRYLKNDECGFAIALPEGWGPIPSDALKSQGEAVSGPNLKIDYIAGYQIVEKEPFVHPFILVRRLPEAVMPRSQVTSAQNLFGKRGDEIAKYVQKESGLQLNLEVGTPVLESETGIVWLKIQLDGIDGERVEGLMAHYYVDGSILQFNAGTTAERATEDWPMLEGILRTIKFD